MEIVLTPRQRLDWLRLIRSENVGPRTFYALIRRYGGAAQALEMLPELARRGGRTQIRIPTPEQADKEMETAEQMQARFVARGERDYPPLLAQIEDAPPLLAIRGRHELFHKQVLAIVGSRNASASGQKLAEEFASQLGAAGCVIVSGLARGIDTRAHLGALSTGTIAVLAGGQDKIYPAENIPLARSIAEQGVVICEMPFGWVARGRDFPRRNRIVSGLSRAVIVIEAAEKSGSLITARLANEQGRDVFALPGSPMDPRANGTNRLIRHGAVLVTSSQDVMEALASPASPRQAGLYEPDTRDDTLDDAPLPDDPPPDLRQRVTSLLSTTPTRYDDLVRLAQAPAGLVRTILMELELAGRIEHHGSQTVSLVAA